MALTIDDILAGYSNDEWCGWGYLGERNSEESERGCDSPRLATADKVVIKVANELEWDRETLFEWLNSKPGRWFCDTAFGNGKQSQKALLAAGRGLFDNQADWDSRGVRDMEGVG